MTEALDDTGARERYRGAALGLLGRLPDHARRVLVIGAGRALEAALLKRQGFPWVGWWALEAAPPALPPGVLDWVGGDATAAMAQAPVDVVLWFDPPADAGAIGAMAEPLCGLLSPEGHALALMRLRDEESAADGGVMTLDGAVAAFTEAGLPVYDLLTPGPRRGAGPGDELLMLVRPDYNPVAVARGLSDAGRPDAAFGVLDAIPKAYTAEEEAWLSVSLEKQLNLLHWMKRDGLCADAAFFSQAAHLFHAVMARRPTCHEAAQLQAELYRAVGAPALGARLLRNLLEAAPHAGAARQLATLPEPPPALEPDIPPPWTPASKPPRVLFVLPERMHYGLDVLFDGLCQVLGQAQLTDFPHKPSLHGAVEEAYKNYPCAFDYPGDPKALETVCAELRDGRYDLVLWGDCENALDDTLCAAVAGAIGRTPAYLVDGLDQFPDTRGAVERRLGLRFRGCFKREMLIGHDYPAGTYPLPFGYPDRLFPEAVRTERDIPLFWAGHRRCGLRRLFLEALERHLGQGLDGEYPQEVYLDRIGRSRIGICLFGYGFDTVRYWELPAHGAALFAERLPIRVPHPFSDGETALHFDGAQEMLARYEALAANPGQVRELAHAGHAHARRHHSGSARARQLLGWIQAQGDLPQG